MMVDSLGADYPTFPEFIVMLRAYERQLESDARISNISRVISENLKPRRKPGTDDFGRQWFITLPSGVFYGPCESYLAAQRVIQSNQEDGRWAGAVAELRHAS